MKCQSTSHSPLGSIKFSGCKTEVQCFSVLNSSCVLSIKVRAMTSLLCWRCWCNSAIPKHCCHSNHAFTEATKQLVVSKAKAELLGSLNHCRVSQVPRTFTRPLLSAARLKRVAGLERKCRWNLFSQHLARSSRVGSELIGLCSAIQTGCY